MPPRVGPTHFAVLAMLTACSPEKLPAKPPTGPSPSVPSTPTVASTDSPARGLPPPPEQAEAPVLAAFMMRGPYASPAAFCAELKAEGPHRARTVCRVDPLRASRKLGALRENGMFVARVDAAETLYYAATKVDSGWYFAAHEAQLTSTTSDRKITLDGSWDSGFVQPDGDLVFHRATFASAEGRSPPTFLTVMLIVGTGESLEPACVGFSSGNTTSRKPLDLALTAPSTVIVKGPLERVETSPAGRARVTPGTYRLAFQ